MEADHHSDEGHDKVWPAVVRQHLDTHDNGHDFGEAGQPDMTVATVTNSAVS